MFRELAKSAKLREYQLPPDNDESFGVPVELVIKVDAWSEDEAQPIKTLGHIVVNEELEAEPALTNRDAREVNLRLMSQGHSPLFIEWSDVLASNTL